MTILSLGLILLTGLFAAKVIRRLRIPVITAYLLLGIAIGPAGLKLISCGILSASGLISNIVLGMIAFSLGQHFQVQRLAKIEKSVFWISIFGAVAPWILVTLVFRFLLNQPLYLALSTNLNQ